MKVEREKLEINEKLYNKLFNLCNFTNVKFEAINGIVFRVKGTNANFIEPHRFIISINDIKLVLLCYDNLNLYLYNKQVPITIPLVSDLIREIKELGGVNNGKKNGLLDY